MLKVRLIPIVILKNNLVVQSFGFNRYLPIGKIDAVIEFLVNWDVDEIIVIDIDATEINRTIAFDTIERVAEKCFVPLTVGGGIRNSDTVSRLLDVGADKISLNSAAIETPEFITKISNKYGAQFVVVSIDAKKIGPNKYEAFTRNGKVSTNRCPGKLAKEMQDLGAGEILINSIDNDGMQGGYDIELLKLVTSSVTVPVIACGGVGKAGDLTKGYTEGNCQAVSAANIFNHTELSTIAGKAIMKAAGVPIRIDSSVKYDNIAFDHLDRPI